MALSSAILVSIISPRPRVRDVSSELYCTVMYCTVLYQHHFTPPPCARCLHWASFHTHQVSPDCSNAEYNHEQRQTWSRGGYSGRNIFQIFKLRIFPLPFPQTWSWKPNFHSEAFCGLIIYIPRPPLILQNIHPWRDIVQYSWVTR